MNSTQNWSILKILSVAIVMAAAFLAAPFTDTNAYAQQTNPITQINPTTLNGAYFKSGSLKMNSTGEWAEYDTKDKIRFTFREILRDETSVFLLNDQHNVSIEINDPDRVIYASWPGQPRHIMHRITSASLAPPAPAQPPVTTAPPYTIEPPIAIEPPMTTAPPFTIEPPISIAPPSQTMKPKDIARAAYNGGEFIKSGENWIDIKNSGKRATYTQLGHDNKNVYLLDSAQNTLIIIDVKALAIRQGQGGKIRRRHKVTELSEIATAPNPKPEEPRTHRPLPASERAECLAAGGIVEQAGILGHERCTKPYSDANISCTDSSQCEGRCLDNSQQSNQTTVIGKCQATDNPFGCFTEVINGETSFGLCVD